MKPLCLAWLLGLAVSCAHAAPNLDAGITAAAGYLHRAIEADGRLRYRVDATTGETVDQRYNVLRHAGSLLALAEYHQQHPPDATQTEAIDRAFGFLRRCCIGPAGEGGEGLAVWTPHDLARGARRYPVAKLGGAGLALAAWAQWRRVHPASVDLAEMQALARYLVSRQRADGGFLSLHAHHSGQHDPQWESLYYPGEAALGLILLHEQDPDGGWLVPAIDALRYLARQREGMADPPPDHWALIATARLFAQEPQALKAALPTGFVWLGPADATAHTALEPLLQSHAWVIVRSLLREQAAQGATCAPGAFTADGRTTPTATRLEGLLAMAPWVPDAAPEHADMRAALVRGAGFLLTAQIADGPASGGFARVAPGCAAVAGVRARDARVVQVDFVQHALAALLGFRTLTRSWHALEELPPAQPLERPLGFVAGTVGSAADALSEMQGR